MWTLALGFFGKIWKPLAIAAGIGLTVWFAYDWAYDRGAASMQARVDEVTRQHEQAVARSVAEFEAADRQWREREKSWEATAVEAAKELDDAYRTNAETELALRKYETDAAGIDARNRRLRDDLATARLIASQASANPAAACHARAATYEQAITDAERLLREGRSLAIRSARAHDDRAAEVEALLKAWPN